MEVGAVLFQGDRRLTKCQTLIDPQCAITAESSSIHQIIDTDVVGMPLRAKAINRLRVFLAPASVYVAHNAVFDAAFLPEISNQKWLCTKRLAQHLWPQSSNGQNQTLRYQLKREVDNSTTHRVMADIEVTASILRQALSVVRE